MKEIDNAITNGIGPVLQRARKNGGLTQTDVAATLGISLWTYNRLENSKRTFTLEWVEKLPERMRRPVTAWLMDRAEARVYFLSRCMPRVGYQRGTPTPPLVGYQRGTPLPPSTPAAA